jgi:tRNA threonylcarbamoyladenosine biosynthesis protein TsaB
VALIRGEETLAEIGFSRTVSPSRWLLPAVRFLLEAGRIPLEKVSVLAVTVGPGSFTGLRVGLATIRGLAMASGRPVAGISTLEALAAGESAGDVLVAPWLDAGRGEVYAGLLRHGREVLPETAAPPETVLRALPPEPILFLGSGAARYHERIRRRPGADAGDRLEPGPSLLAGSVARAGVRALAAGTALPLQPRYLRPPDATRARA